MSNERADEEIPIKLSNLPPPTPLLNHLFIVLDPHSTLRSHWINCSKIMLQRKFSSSSSCGSYSAVSEHAAQTVTHISFQLGQPFGVVFWHFDGVLHQWITNIYIVYVRHHHSEIVLIVRRYSVCGLWKRKWCHGEIKSPGWKDYYLFQRFCGVAIFNWSACLKDTLNLTLIWSNYYSLFW